MSPLKTPYLNSMDAARAILAIAGIFLHASIAYMVPLSGFHWPIVSAHKNLAFDFLALWIHAFRMPTFFFLAGFFASVTYCKTDIYSLMKKRLCRIGIPFAVISLFPILLWIAAEWTLYRTINFHMVWQQLNDLGPYWFLYYLLLMYVCIFIIWNTNCLIKKFYRLAFSIENLLKNPIVQAILFLLVVSFLFLTGCWMLPYSGTLKPPVYLFLFYFSFFLIGWIINRIKLNIHFYAQYCFYFLCASSLVYVVYFTLFMTGAHSWLCRLMTDTCLVLMIWLFIPGFLGLTLRYWNFPSRVWNYLAGASYWIYLVHVSVVITLQGLFNFVTIPIGLKYICICVITLMICTISYHILVRNTKLGLLLYLNGQKIKDDYAGNVATIGRKTKINNQKAIDTV